MEQDVRKSLAEFRTRLCSAVDGEVDSLAAELVRLVEEGSARAREAAEADAAAREAAARDEARATAEAEAETATARYAADAATARATEREARLAAVERLLTSVRRIDAATTLRETLEVLAESASLETPRVAVLLIEENNVRPFSHRGFDDLTASGPIAAGGVIEACVQHGQTAFTGDAAGLKAPGFAALPDDRAGFAVPLRVGNKTVAVLYADDAAGEERDAPAAWPESLELLARHASVHLENMTVLRAINASTPGSQSAPSTEARSAGTANDADDEAARRYARLLISEIKLYNEPAVRLGREHKDLRSRLGDEIKRAHRTYLARIPASVAARDAYFETELVQTLAGGDPSIL